MLIYSNLSLKFLLSIGASVICKIELNKKLFQILKYTRLIVFLRLNINIIKKQCIIKTIKMSIDPSFKCTFPNLEMNACGLNSK